MRHIIKERGLRLIGVLRSCKGILQIYVLSLQLCFQPLLIINIYEEPYKGNRRTILPSGQPSGGMEPSPPGLPGKKTVFYIIVLLITVISYGIPEFLNRPCLIVLMQQIRP